MAGHAPHYGPTERLFRWVESLSDYRISLYMLLTAAGFAALTLAVGRTF